MKKLVPLAVAALAGVASAQSLVTAGANNGSGGVFLDITPAAGGLEIVSFEVPYTGTVGTAVQVEVWTRPGTYVGSTGGNAGWTLRETVAGLRAGTTTNSPLTLATPLPIPAGGTTGVYLHCITTGGGLRYSGTTALPPQTTWVNADLTMFSDTARTGNVAFAGTLFTPRCFSGVINYRPAAGGCRADLNGDGVADFNDYLEFLNLYNANDLRVDFNSDGVVDFNDYLEFLNLYNGCQ